MRSQGNRAQRWSAGLVLVVMGWLLVLQVRADEPAVMPPLADAYQAEAQELLADADVRARWLALLHIQQGRLQIENPQFLLSLPDYSPEREMALTRTLFERDANNICRFPARHLFLQQAGVRVPARPACADFEAFTRKIPADTVSVVYATEYLTETTSMMGHGMLALSGTNGDGNPAAYAVTFFTEIDTYNPVSLFYQTIIAGKDGFFIVQSLSAHYRYYLLEYQRPVWRYDIRMDADQRQLLQAHVWELKQFDILYQFDTLNCATMALDLLALAYPDINQDVGWVSPLDVARIVEQRGIVSGTRIDLASRWQTRRLSYELGSDGREAALALLDPETPVPTEPVTLADDEQQRKIQQLALHYQDWRYETGLISEVEWQQGLQRLPERADLADPEADAAYRRPMLNPLDAQMSFGVRQEDQRSWMLLNWVPAGHQLTDDYRHNFTEYELQVMAPTLKVSDTGEVRLHRLQIFSAAGMTPYESLTGGWSGRLALGIEPVVDEKLDTHSAFQLQTAGGLGLALNDSWTAYGLLGVGTDLRPAERYGWVAPEVGTYFYWAEGLKTRLFWKPRWRLQQELLQQTGFSQTLTFSPQHALLLEADQWRSAELQRTDVQLQWRWYY
ncbi:DUF4105 domain-containing protein [Parathalassolituus penaei]|uniref:DUF4105 domain-containing protein n=1 Tax=Parathalassolituus penaei TaxID=2997323 RepID=A0A9X3EEJ1_9GAMM|nr:DUF4105 domain-containing protein [Parathalassolituus penaei]MCY0965245.1 DUF4105 domain-containing protein [Parathalassolituus penaei]